MCIQVSHITPCCDSVICVLSARNPGLWLVKKGQQWYNLTYATCTFKRATLSHAVISAICVLSGRNSGLWFVKKGQQWYNLTYVTCTFKQAMLSHAVITVICVLSGQNPGLWLVRKGQQWYKCGMCFIRAKSWPLIGQKRTTEVWVWHVFY